MGSRLGAIPDCQISYRKIRLGIIIWSIAPFESDISLSPAVKFLPDPYSTHYLILANLSNVHAYPG